MLLPLVFPQVDNKEIKKIKKKKKKKIRKGQGRVREKNKVQKVIYFDIIYFPTTRNLNERSSPSIANAETGSVRSDRAGTVRLKRSKNSQSFVYI